MRWMFMAAGVAALAGAGLCLEAQAGSPKKPTPMMVTTGSPTAPKRKAFAAGCVCRMGGGG